MLDDLKHFVLHTRRVIFVTSSGYGNIGQEAIVNGAVAEMKHVNPQINIVSNSYNPTLSKQIHLFSNLSFFKTLSLHYLGSIIFSQVVIILGDELSSEKIDLYYKGNRSYLESKLKIFLAFLSILLKKKVVFYSIGLYTFQRNFPKNIFLFSVMKAFSITVRDDATICKMRQLGVKRKILIQKDPSYSMGVPLEQKRTKEVMEIGISLMDPIDDKNEKLTGEFISALFKKLSQADFNFFIFANHPAIKYEQDIIFTKRIISKYVKKNAHYSLVQSNNPVEVKSRINVMDFFVAMRYHAALFCEALNVPFIILPASRKIEQSFNGKKELISFEQLSSYLKSFKIKNRKI